MALSIFGYKIIKDKESEKEKSASSFVPPADEIDGGWSIEPTGGRFGHILDTSGTNYKGEIDLIMKYRQIALQPEVDAAIEDIVSEAIASDEDSAPVELVTEDISLPSKVIQQIHTEFEEIVELLNFNWYGHEIFRRWYIDGRLYYHKIIDENNPKNGIIEIRPIDPTKLQRKKEAEKGVDEYGNEIVIDIKDYYIYNKGQVTGTPGPTGGGQGFVGLSGGMAGNNQSIKVLGDAITFASSGLLDPSRTMVIGHLHKAIKSVNQLSMLEDALVIYRLARAPERRIFYIDVGNLPKGAAEEYVNGIMSKYRNKMTYDANTGEYKDNVRHMSMLEDFWLPRREGGKGTEISTLPGGDNLGQIDDVVYFQKKLYNSLNVPSSRLNSDDNPMVSIGRANETTREELKYQKHISRLRKRFSALFIDILKDQLIIKGILNIDEWNAIAQDISVRFSKDNYFSELTKAEILRDRIATVRELDEFTGKYFSKEWVRKNVLHQSDEDIRLMDIQMEKEVEEEPEDENASFEEWLAKNRGLDHQTKLYEQISSFIDSNVLLNDEE